METVCAETRKLLAPFVRRPPLTDKLLARPPFRFLHDVIMEIMRATGFFEGLFAEEEMVSDNVKDRDSKIAFLQKIIDVINIVNDTKCSVKPTKVIAGQEPEKTNELLQQIGIALKNKSTSTEAVEIIKGDKPKEKPITKQKKTTPTSKKNTKPNEIEKKTKEQLSDKEKVGSKKVMKDKSTNKKQEKVKPEKKDTMKTSPVDTTESDKEISPKIEPMEAVSNKILASDLFGEENVDVSLPSEHLDVQSKEEIPTDKTIEIPMPQTEENDNAEPATNFLVESPNIPERSEGNDENTKLDKKSALRRKKITEEVVDSKKIKSSKISERIPLKLVENKEDPKEMVPIHPTPQLKPPTIRPSSARPGAPRLKENSNVDVIFNSSEPVAMGKVNVIVETYDKDNPEDDEGTIVLESGLENVISDSGIEITEIQKSGHGQLVKQIIETQKVLGNQDSNKIESDWKWEAQKDKDATYKEMEALRNRLQSMSKAANPLGKLIDFVREDVEVMRQELLHWRKLKKEVGVSLNQQKSLTDQFVTQLQLKIKQMDDQISEQVKSIRTVKSNIYQNSQKIKQLVSTE